MSVVPVAHNDTYTVARCLYRAGQWDLAVRHLPAGPAGAALRAEILTDRHLWRLDASREARAAIDAVAAERPDLATYLTAQLDYWRRLLGHDETRPGDGQDGGPDPAESFAALRERGSLAGWATFWHAVTRENLHADSAGAAGGYTRARDLAQDTGDRMLESYALRHLAWQAREAGDRAGAVALARRSLYLRAACGARPHVAAAQAWLAEILGDCAESADLRAIVAVTAAELGLAWLSPADTR